MSAEAWATERHSFRSPVAKPGLHIGLLIDCSAPDAAPVWAPRDNLPFALELAKEQT